MAQSRLDSVDSFELVERAQKGNNEALGELYQRYWARVRKIIRMHLRPPLRKRYDSVDIYNEAFVVAIQKIHSLEMRSEVGLISWLAKIAVNNISNHEARKSVQVQRGVESIVEATTSGAIQLEPEAQVELPIENVVKKEEQEHLEDCMALLPDDYREAIILRRYARPPGATENVPWSVVGEELGISADAARVREARARVELADLMRRHWGGESE